MAEPKNMPIMVNLEPTVHSLMQQVLLREGITASAYGRSLVIKDLRAKGVLTDEILLDVVLTAGAK